MNYALTTKEQVSALLSISQATLDRLWKSDPSFPQPIRVAGQLRWYGGEIENWIKAEMTRARKAANDNAKLTALRSEKSRLDDLREAHTNSALMPEANGELDALVSKIDAGEITRNDARKATAHIREDDDRENDPENGGAA